jgi:hypothetical protein
MMETQTYNDENATQIQNASISKRSKFMGW